MECGPGVEDGGIGIGAGVRSESPCSAQGWALGWAGGGSALRWGLDSGPGLTLVLDGVVGQSEGMQHTAPVLPKHPGQLLDKVPSGKGEEGCVCPRLWASPPPPSVCLAGAPMVRGPHRWGAARGLQGACCGSGVPGSGAETKPSCGPSIPEQSSLLCG